MSVVRNLNRQLGELKIQISHWEIADQGITALKGPSGSGKTQIIRTLLGLEKCPSLSWEFAGEDLAKLPIEKRRLGVVFQGYELFPHLTARENIEFAARARKIPKEELAERIADFATKLKLNDCLDRRADKLSGGEQQRVALARALMGRPRFLFLDEPFSALDSELRAEARALVKRIISEEKIPTLLVSHDAADIAELADHVETVPGYFLRREPSRPNK